VFDVPYIRLCNIHTFTKSSKSTTCLIFPLSTSRAKCQTIIYQGLLPARRCMGDENTVSWKIFRVVIRQLNLNLSHSTLLFLLLLLESLLIITQSITKKHYRAALEMNSQSKHFVGGYSSILQRRIQIYVKQLCRRAKKIIIFCEKN